MRAVAYCRVSTEDQVNDRQLADIRKRCEIYNYSLIKEFSEIESGKMKVRPVLTEMLNFVSNPLNEVDMVIISEISRLGRTYEVVKTIEQLTKIKICVFSLKEELRTLNADKTENFTANMTINILSSINSYELTTLKYRMNSGTKQKVSKGRVVGNNWIAYGYYKESLENKLLKIEEKEKKVIETIFKMCADGIGTKKIANYLNNNNIPTKTQLICEKSGESYKTKKYKKVWIQSVVYQILRNSIYIGKRNYLHETYNIPELRIIKDEVWNKAQEELDKRGVKVPFKKYVSLFDSKKIICGVCGKPYFRRKEENSKKSEFVGRYICSSRRIQEPCENIGISTIKIERLIQSVILHRYKNILREQLDNKELKNEIKELKNEIEKLEKDLQKEINNEVNNIQKNNDGILDDDAYLIIWKKIKNNKDTIVSKINLSKIKLNDLEFQYNNSIDIKKLTTDFNRLGKNLPSKIINSIVNKIIITKIEECDQMFQDICDEMLKQVDNRFTKKNKQDKIIMVTIVSGSIKLYYFISQRDEVVFDLQSDCFRIPFAMGFSGWEESVNIKTEIPHKYLFNL